MINALGHNKKDVKHSKGKDTKADMLTYIFEQKPAIKNLMLRGELTTDAVADIGKNGIKSAYLKKAMVGSGVATRSNVVARPAGLSSGMLRNPVRLEYHGRHSSYRDGLY